MNTMLHDRLAYTEQPETWESIRASTCKAQESSIESISSNTIESVQFYDNHRSRIWKETTEFMEDVQKKMDLDLVGVDVKKEEADKEKSEAPAADEHHNNSSGLLLHGQNQSLTHEQTSNNPPNNPNRKVSRKENAGVFEKQLPAPRKTTCVPVTFSLKPTLPDHLPARESRGDPTDTLPIVFLSNCRWPWVILMLCWSLSVLLLLEIQKQKWSWRAATISLPQIQ